jgi:sulfatase modifying factor 1
MACYLFCLDAGVFADGDGTGSNLLSDVGRTLQRVCFKSCWLIRPRSNSGRRVFFRYSSPMLWRHALSIATGAFAFTAGVSAGADAPDGMVWIPGGEFSMGAAVNGHGSCEMAMPSNDAEPIHRVRVDGIWMDKTVVTNDQFAKFVDATGYVTIAERTPTKEEFPTAPAENLVAGSVVFSPPDHEVPLNNHFQWWNYVKGANWRHPLGPDSDIKGKEKHPAVHIAYPDAEAYAKWAGKRLPTEAEFEFAERGRLAGKT